MMDFEEMQKVWDEQKGETMYAINKNALYRSVARKKDAVGRRINRVEIAAMLINGSTALFLFFIALYGNHNWGFVTSPLLAGTVVYVQYFRWKRKKIEKMFDRSMLGELDHAISNMNFIIRFNYLMVVGYLVPLSVIIISKMILSSASLEKWLITTGFFLLAFFLVRREQKSCNIPRKRHLQALKKKLVEE